MTDIHTISRLGRPICQAVTLLALFVVADDGYNRNSAAGHKLSSINVALKWRTARRNRPSQLVPCAQRSDIFYSCERIIYRISNEPITNPSTTTSTTHWEMSIHTLTRQLLVPWDCRASSTASRCTRDRAQCTLQWSDWRCRDSTASSRTTPSSSLALPAFRISATPVDDRTKPFTDHGNDMQRHALTGPRPQFR